QPDPKTVSAAEVFPTCSSSPAAERGRSVHPATRAARAAMARVQEVLFIDADALHLAGQVQPTRQSPAICGDRGTSQCKVRARRGHAVHSKTVYCTTEITDRTRGRSASARRSGP